MTTVPMGDAPVYTPTVTYRSTPVPSSETEESRALLAAADAIISAAKRTSPNSSPAVVHGIAAFAIRYRLGLAWADL